MPDIYKCKNFSKTGKVQLPSKWRKEFGLLPGKLAELTYIKKQVIIQKAQINTLNNKRIITENGAIFIPKELQLLLNVDSENEYCLFIDEMNEAFILKILDSE
jgi:bifunctional DNA-binding transcriptional regulator/antitoxin component of YhaV-PrlF toxin-antitoxin module